jgi:AraC-like DNA-binding protein
MPTLYIDASRFIAPRGGAGPAAQPAPAWLADANRVCASGDGAGLSIRSVLSGHERLESAHRTIRLDPDSYLIQNRLDTPPGRSQVDGRAVWLVFSASQLARALAGVALPAFHEHLRPRGDAVGAQLAVLEQALLAGGAAPQWFDGQCVRLLEALLRGEAGLEAAALRIDCVKPATRQELLHRIRLATDFILSHHEQPLQLEDIARAARLSRFHLVRLFRQVLGVTPHAYLLDKRLAVARRMLAQREGDLSEVAMHAGFGSRWSLFRRLQGAGGLRGGTHVLAPGRRTEILQARDTA